MSTIKAPSSGSGMGMSRAAKKRKRMSDCTKRNFTSPSPAVAPDAQSIFINLEDKAFKKVDSNKLDSLSTIAGCDDFIKLLSLKEVQEVTSRERAELLLSYIINPINLEQFYTMHWQKAPLNINRNMDSYWDTILTTKKLRIILKKILLVTGRDIAVYPTWDKNSTSKTQKELKGNDAFSACSIGHTVLLLNPIKYVDSLWQLCSALEHEFSASVGCQIFLSSMSGTAVKPSAVYEESVTLTDSFFLQLDNRSTWTTSNPAIDAKGKTTTAQSHTLEVGDVLYVPKGWSLRQTLPLPSTSDCASPSLQSNLFSLTLQIYTNESNSVGDILQLLLPQAIQKATSSSRVLRNALPTDFNYFMGVAAAEQLDDDTHMNDRLQQEKNTVSQFQSPVAEQKNNKKGSHSKKKKTPASQTPRGEANVSDDIDDQDEIVAQQESIFHGSGNGSSSEDSRRTSLLQRLRRGFKIVSDAAMSSIDACFDQYIAKELVLKRLPVPLTAEEEAVTAAGAPHATIFPYTRLRMLRPGIAAVAVEDGKVVLFHCMDNSRENRRLLQTHLQDDASAGQGGDYDGEDDLAAPFVPLEFELDDGPCIEALIHAYPNSVEVSELYHPSEELEDKIAVAQALYKEGFLLIDDVASLPRGATQGQGSDGDADDDDPF